MCIVHYIELSVDLSYALCSLDNKRCLLIYQVARKVENQSLFSKNKDSADFETDLKLENRYSIFYWIFVSLFCLLFTNVVAII